MFREGVLMVPYKTDENVGIMCAVLNNVPVPVLIFNNEYWQYWNNIIRCECNSSEVNSCIYSEH